MSEENVKLAYRGHETFNRRDLGAFLEQMDPDTEFMPYEIAVQGGQAYRGHAGMRAWWNETLEVMPDFRVDIDEARDLGDKVLVHGRIHGHGAGSGVAFERPLWGVMEFRGGMQVRYRTFENKSEALDAAGLSEND
jgi:ketosteroid isomerase-like protein